MKGKKTGVQAKIKAVYSNAHFIHCYAHQLNLITKNTASIHEMQDYFSLTFWLFQHSSQDHRNLCPFSRSMWTPAFHVLPLQNFNIRTINRVHKNLEPSKKHLTEIQSTSNANQTIAEATGILKYLNGGNFMFWLELFHQIIPHVKVIYNQMQSCEISVFKVNEYITNFKTAVLEIGNSKYCENPSQTLVAEAKEVCNCICVDMVDRYSSPKHLVAAKLFNKERFNGFKNELRTEEIIPTTESYPMIDKEKLETELKVFYCRSDIHEYIKLVDLLKLILENNLYDVLSEITKLIKILLTTPMITSEPERCFSTLKRIKTFVWSTMNSEGLNALTMLSMEKSFFSSHPEIKKKIVNLFAQIKIRKIDFILKGM